MSGAALDIRTTAECLTLITGIPVEESRAKLQKALGKLTAGNPEQRKLLAQHGMLIEEEHDELR